MRSSQSAFAERVLAAHRLELVDELPMATQRQVRLGSGLDGHHGQFLEVCSFGNARIQRRRIRPAARRGAARAPRQAWRTQAPRRPPRSAATFCHQLFEADDVYLFGPTARA